LVRRFLSYNQPVPTKSNPAPRQFKVGDHIRVSMSGGKIVDAIIKAVMEHKDGLRFQVAFGRDQTALIGEWQIVKK
jgi:hypothetical protein